MQVTHIVKLLYPVHHLQTSIPYGYISFSSRWMGIDMVIKRFRQNVHDHVPPRAVSIMSDVSWQSIEVPLISLFEDLALC